MTTAILINENAGSAARAEAIREFVDGAADTTCWTSTTPSECEALVQRALDEGAERLVAAGGDGTIHHVVNALQRLEADVCLGIVPMGTGNDLAQTLAIPAEPEAALEVLATGSERPLDLFHLQAADADRYGINVAVGGFGGEVDTAVSGELKATWGPLAYLIGAASMLPDVQEYDTHIAYDDGALEAVNALNIVIANGRTAAGGHAVAPAANPCDGLLDIVIVHSGSAAALTEVAARLVAGNYLESEWVSHRRAERVTVRSEPGMWFNVDGELLTREPVTIRVLPARQRVIVGPAFAAVPRLGT